MGEASLWWGLLFGSVGLGYLVYGRRQKAAVPLLCGIALIVFPYFVANVWAMVLVGALLLALPWFARI
jgi:hypothetical protein